MNGLTYGGWLITHTFAVMSLLFIPLLIFLALNFKYFIKTFKQIDPRILILLLVIFLAGFFMRNAQYRYGMDVDGMYYQEMAKNIFENHIFAQGCAVGTPRDCLFWYESVVLPGYPYLIASLFQLFGVHDIFSMLISGFLGSLSILLVFLLYFLLFNQPRGALIAATVFSFLPVDVYICSTAAVRPTAIFFMLFTLIFFMFSLKEKKISLWIATFLWLSFTIYVRLEFYLILVPMAVFLAFARSSFSRRDWMYLFTGVSVFLLHQLFAFSWLLHRNFGLTGGRYKTFSLDYLSSSLPAVFSYMFLNKIKSAYLFVPFISIFFLVGLIYFLIFRERRRELFFISLWFAVFLTGIALFFHGAYENETIRYLQSLGPPYALLAGFTIDHFSRKWKENKAFFGFMMIIIISLFFCRPLLKPDFLSDKRRDEYFVRNYLYTYDKLPPHALVLTWQSQVFNFDFMRDKDLIIATYGQNQSGNFNPYTEAFINALKANKDRRWFYIPLCCDRNKFCITVEKAEHIAVQAFHEFGLYEIFNKDGLIARIEEDGI